MNVYDNMRVASSLLENFKPAYRHGRSKFGITWYLQGRLCDQARCSIWYVFTLHYVTPDLSTLPYSQTCQLSHIPLPLSSIFDSCSCIFSLTDWQVCKNHEGNCIWYYLLFVYLVLICKLSFKVHQFAVLRYSIASPHIGVVLSWRIFLILGCSMSQQYAELKQYY